MRKVDGLKVVFVKSESYFKGFDTPSMGSTAKIHDADVVVLLEHNYNESDISDADIREVLAYAQK